MAWKFQDHQLLLRVSNASLLRFLGRSYISQQNASSLSTLPLPSRGERDFLPSPVHPSSKHLGALLLLGYVLVARSRHEDVHVRRRRRIHLA